MTFGRWTRRGSRRRATRNSPPKGLDLSPRTVTSLADVLERDGLIRRMPHATDRRAVLARITPEGRARVDALWAEAFERHFPIFEGFTEDEIAQLRHLCFKLLDNLTNGSA